MSVITKFGYKNYTGSYLSRSYRIWQICLFNLKERIWNQKSVQSIYIILFFLSLIVIIPLVVISSSTAGTGPNGPITFLQSILLSSGIDLITFFSNMYGLIIFSLLSNPLTFILFGFIGGKVVSEDIEYKTLEQYFTRVRKTDYLLGKFLALFLSYFGSMIILAFMFYYFLCSTVNYGLFEIDPLVVFVKIILYVFIITLTLTLFMLAISAATEKKNYASLIFILILLIIGDVFKVFNTFFHSDLYLLFNPQEVMLVLLKGLISFTDSLNNFIFIIAINPGSLNTTVTFPEALGLVSAVSIVSFIYLIRRIRTIWS